MTGGSATNASQRLVLAIVTLVVATGGGSGGAGRGRGQLGPYTVSAHQFARHGAGMLGGSGEEGGGIIEEPAAVVRAAVVHEAGVGTSLEGSATSGSGGEHDHHEAEANEASAEQQQQQQQLPQEESNNSRSLSGVGRRRYGKRPRRETFASSPGLHRVDVVGGTRRRQKHSGRVAGETLQHARWDGGRCWFDEIGRPRCQANVFLFGVSKCGESGERSLSHSSSAHHTQGWAPPSRTCWFRVSRAEGDGQQQQKQVAVGSEYEYPILKQRKHLVRRYDSFIRYS